jgi:hypothetical protein
VRRVCFTLMDPRKPNHFDDENVIHLTADKERTLYTSACDQSTNAPDDIVETDKPVTCPLCLAVMP